MIYIIVDNKVVSHSSGCPRSFPKRDAAWNFCRNHWIEANNENRARDGLTGEVHFVTSIKGYDKRLRIND